MRNIAVLAALALAAPALAQPVTLSFSRINGNAPVDVASQFTAVVDDGPGDTVTFRFTNNATIASSIMSIYFDDRADLLAFDSFVTQTGTNFTSGGVTPPNLPGGQNLTPPFQADATLSVGASGNPNNGINAAGDVLVVSYDLLGGNNFADVLAALNSGALRIGFHVQSIGATGDSDAFVNNPPNGVIPLPTTAALAAAGLCGLAVRRRR
ncbi:MAG TPA: hypothetical protein VD997_11075 [Phycisphaerales bacterium]|nr:hypothetical protein [Phycisphaerales bacterium]